jgi:exodeoxyribonuclease VII large subunit
LGRRAEELGGLGRRLGLATARVVERAEQRLGALSARLEGAGPRVRVSILGERTFALGRRLAAVAPGLTRASERRIELAARTLESVSPLKVLARGYSTTARLSGDERQGLTRASDAAVGDELETRLASGVLRSRVTEIEEGS